MNFKKIADTSFKDDKLWGFPKKSNFQGEFYEKPIQI